ncbi:MAG TPA: acetamidase/formamidase family protein [Vicinamibacterales bacterium]|nr:acetamidase/formamidase family protein [Vicinamibacterales bacterium]
MTRWTVGVVMAVAIPVAGLAAGRPRAPRRPAFYRLNPTPATVAYGYYDAATKPVLRIHSGDTVEVGTLITSTPARLEKAGVPAGEVQSSLKSIVDTVTDKGPGGHILTGPIYVDGAEPGDVLEVQIRKIRLDLPYAYNAFGPKSGFLPEDFHESRMKIIPLDRKAMVARFAPGIVIPLHPFFGSIGDAPPPSAGRVSSNPPGTNAGNLDDKHLVAGTTPYIPVHAPGALFQVGDGHAGQGDGEVDITAMETSLTGTFRLIVRKDMHLAWPEAETPTRIITMGMDKDLTTATKIAVRQMIDYLVTERHLTREDAYMLSSVAADLSISELVDGNVNVQMSIPKAIFTHRASR